MCVFTPTITSDDHLLIVSYYSTDMCCHNDAYKIPVANITSTDHSNTSTKWTELTPADHYHTALVPGSSPPVVVGGQTTATGGTPTEDIKIYDYSNKSWKKIGSLSSARIYVAVAAVYNNAIIIIGGYTKGGSNCKSSSVTVVELGQAELHH